LLVAWQAGAFELVLSPALLDELRQALAWVDARTLRCSPDRRLSAGPMTLLSPQLTAFFTSAAIRSSSAGVSFVRNQLVGHMVPASRLAAWSNPNVAYRSLYFEAALKKQMTLPSLA
jgi:hypothetical protein